jgi:O-antigen ligase
MAISVKVPVRTESQVKRMYLPGWAFFFLALVAPLSILRLQGINLTLFDFLAVIALSFYLLRGGRYRLLGWAVIAYVFVLTLMLSAFRAPDQLAALSHIAQWLFIFLVVVPLVYSAVRSDGGRRSIIAGFVLATAIIAAYGAYEVLLSGQRNRYTSIYDSPQTLGFQIAVIFPFLLVALRSIWEEVSRVFLKVLLLLLVMTLVGAMFWLLFYSLSRTGMLATVLGTLAFLALDVMALKNPREFWKRVLLGAILVAVLVGATVLMTRDTRFVERVTDRIAVTLDLESPEVTDRTDVWQEALTQIDQSYYFLGVGPDNYQNISRYNQKPHNVFILFLTEGGAIAALAFAALLAYFFVKTIPVLVASRRRPSFDRAFLTGAVASMVAYTVIAMLNTQSLDRLYWLVFAAGVATAVDLRARMRTVKR